MPRDRDRWRRPTGRLPRSVGPRAGRRPGGRRGACRRGRTCRGALLALAVRWTGVAPYNLSTVTDSAIAFDDRGLVPCIAQDWRTGEVLTLAYMNEEALERTRATGEVHYWSRSRDELWHKGATSGNVQKLKALRIDCDGDALLALVEPAGPACHTGERTCFFTGDLTPAAP